MRALTNEVMAMLKSLLPDTTCSAAPMHNASDHIRGDAGDARDAGKHPARGKAVVCDQATPQRRAAREPQAVDRRRSRSGSPCGIAPCDEGELERQRHAPGKVEHTRREGKRHARVCVQKNAYRSERDDKEP